MVNKTFVCGWLVAWGPLRKGCHLTPSAEAEKLRAISHPPSSQTIHLPPGDSSTPGGTCPEEKQLPLPLAPEMRALLSRPGHVTSCETLLA